MFARCCFVRLHLHCSRPAYPMDGATNRGIGQYTLFLLVMSLVAALRHVTWYVYVRRSPEVGSPSIIRVAEVLHFVRREVAIVGDSRTVVVARVLSRHCKHDTMVELRCVTPSHVRVSSLNE